MAPTSRESRLGQAWTTYYEHGVFMVYLPNDFRDYLGRVVTGVRDWMRDPRALDLMAWGTVLTYQARMEPFRFNDVLTRYYEPGRGFRKGYDREGTPLWQPMFRLQLTMQLAQEVVTNRANIEGRIDEYPTQAQLLFDTLYYVTAIHDLEKPIKSEIKISKDDLRTYLRERAKNDRGPVLDPDFPDPERLAYLWDELWHYLNLLAKPAELREMALTDSRRLRGSPQERQLQTRLLRAILPTPVISGLVRERPPTVETPRAQGPPPTEEPPPAEEISFFFLLNRFGIDPTALDKADPLGNAREAGTALGFWEGMLSTLFESATDGQRTAADAGILEQTPSWEAIAQARGLLSDMLSDRAEAVALEAVSRPEEEVRGRRFAAEQLQAALEMLDVWRDVFREGVRAATVAARAVPAGGWPERRRIALRALGAFCRLDQKEQPADVLSFFEKDLVWPPGVVTAAPPEPSESSGSFVENPKALDSYCNDLLALAAAGEREATAVDWPALWSNFWSLWEFQPTIVALHRRSSGSTPPGSPAAAQSAGPDPARATGLAVLHAARHGGIPVSPGLRGNLSIGQWWRLVILAVFGDESIPLAAVSAALRALGFPEDFERFQKNSLSDFRAQSVGNAPVLFISILSASSPAWEWQPDRRVAAIMPPPPDVGEADRAAIPDSKRVQNEFDNVWDRAKQRAQSRSPREWVRRLRGRVWRRPWHWLRPLPSVRSLDLIKCQEIGPEFDPSERAAGVYLFGFEPVPPGVSGYIASPAGIADLLQRIRDMEQRQQSG